MILLIVTVVLFLGLLAAGVLQIKQKVIALGACVILLVVCNFINQLLASGTSRHEHRHHLPKQDEKIVEKLAVGSIAVFQNENQEQRGVELLQEQREMVGYLWKRWEGREFALVHFENFHKHRLKLVIEMVNHRVNNTHPQRNIILYHLEFLTHYCDAKCLKKTFPSLPKEAYGILLIENVRNAGQLTILQDFYTQNPITIIFQNIPRFFGMHTISRLTYRFPFSNNYLPKILEQHPSKTIEHCSLYRSFDYHFYAASMTVPLLELCNRPLPSTPAVKCVKRYLSEQKMRVPEHWVRKCLAQEGQEGLIVENGWVGIKKQYFWSGKMNRTEPLPDQEDL